MKKEIKYTNTGYSYIECTKEECYRWGGACIEAMKYKVEE